WRNGETCRDLIEDRKWLKQTEPAASSASRPGAAGLDGDSAAAEIEEREYKVEVDGRLHAVKVIGAAAPAAAPANPGPAGATRRAPRRERKAGGAATSAASEALVSPLQGTVLRVAVEEGA